eukprot:scaffold91128_cov35-Phaeocystis_antarctica.AAC.1
MSTKKRHEMYGSACMKLTNRMHGTPMNHCLSCEGSGNDGRTRLRWCFEMASSEELLASRPHESGPRTTPYGSESPGPRTLLTPIPESCAIVIGLRIIAPAWAAKGEMTEASMTTPSPRESRSHSLIWAPGEILTFWPTLAPSRR